MFTFEKDREYHTVGEFLNRVVNEKRLKLDRHPSERKYILKFPIARIVHDGLSAILTM